MLNVMNSHKINLEFLRSIFGERVQFDVPLKRFTAARVGGPADAFLVADNAEELADFARQLWSLNIPFMILGGGSNVLVSDAGVRSVVILNHARQIRFDEASALPTVWAESGANLGLVARLAASKGLSGLEWAAGIPGTIGGAVYGNAGAHDGDIASNFIVADILHLGSEMQTDMQNSEKTFQRENYSVEKMCFSYRSSLLKPSHPAKFDSCSDCWVVLSAKLQLQRGNIDAIQSKVYEFTERRHKTQPPGASMGSMFKNPPGDYSGRLIEACGLKGMTRGDAEISPLHANFFINKGNATADDINALIEVARKSVKNSFGIELELEIQKIGEW